MFGHVLRTVDRAVLTARAAEANHQICKTTLFISCDRRIYKRITVLKIIDYLTVILKELYHLRVKAVKRLIAFILTGIVYCSTVKDIASAVA